MTKNKLILGAVAISAFIGAVGGSTLNAIQVSAATDTPTATPAAQVGAPGNAPQGQPSGSFDPSKGGHVGANGTKEVLLTGDTADKVKAAALAAVPGGKIERVETDAEGSVYEAHMTKSDGSHLTVKVGSNFTVTSTEDGMH